MEMKKISPIIRTAIISTCLLSVFSNLVSAEGTVSTKPPILKSEPRILWEGKTVKDKIDEIENLLEKLGPLLLENPTMLSRLDFELSKMLNADVSKISESIVNFPPTAKEETQSIVNAIKDLVEYYIKVDAEYFKSKGKVLGLSQKIKKLLASNFVTKSYFQKYLNSLKSESASR
jgi:hypothetical protein